VAGKRKLDFLVLRYAPSAVSGERVNFGIIGLEQEGSFVDVRLTNSWDRLRCIDPDVDVEWLESLERELRRGLAGDRSALLKRVEESFSNAVQLSEWTGCLTEDPTKEMEVLSGIYLPRPRGSRGERTLSERERIRAGMRQAFETAGVWELGMKRIEVAPYTEEGDSFTIDFGYRVGKELKMFHSVPVRTNVYSAYALAVKFPRMVAGAAREGVDTSLTAVIEDGAQNSRDATIALNSIREAGMMVAAVSQMPEIAERARVELRA
jgi:hypothetical protein